MAIAGLNLGIDLGSANTAVCLPGQGVALREAVFFVGALRVWALA